MATKSEETGTDVETKESEKEKGGDEEVTSTSDSDEEFLKKLLTVRIPKNFSGHGH